MTLAVSLLFSLQHLPVKWNWRWQAKPGVAEALFSTRDGQDHATYFSHAHVAAYLVKKKKIVTHFRPFLKIIFDLVYPVCTHFWPILYVDTCPWWFWHAHVSACCRMRVAIPISLHTLLLYQQYAHGLEKLNTQYWVLSFSSPYCSILYAQEISLEISEGGGIFQVLVECVHSYHHQSFPRQWLDQEVLPGLQGRIGPFKSNPSL